MQCNLSNGTTLHTSNAHTRESEGRDEPCQVLDTSVLIDGRITDLCVAGLIEGMLIIPHFVLRELARIAEDPLKYNRAKRGLETIRQLRPLKQVTISKLDFKTVVSVDDKLVALAKRLAATLITNDAGLEEIARRFGVTTLNIHRLAFALRPEIFPGQKIRLPIIHKGRQHGQGIGYLDNGVPIVTQDGQRFIGQVIEVTIQNLLLKPTGAIYFAKPDGSRLEDQPVINA